MVRVAPFLTHCVFISMHTTNMYAPFLKNSMWTNAAQPRQNTETGPANDSSRDHDKQCYDWFRSASLHWWLGSVKPVVSTVK